MSKVPIYTEEDFKGMRKAGKIAAEILDYITDFVEPGVSTGYLDDLCYKKRRGKKTNMMNHTKWNLDNKTVLPTSLRPKYINKRDKLGHLEIDSIIGKNNEYDSIISIVDRCSRRVWLIKSEYKQEYYTANLIYNYIIKNKIIVKSKQ